MNNPADQDMAERINALGMVFRRIPAGEFLMGSDKGPSDERPVHKVRITKPFYLGAKEVTQGQWETVMGNNPSYVLGTVDHPVEMASWDDTVEFCRKLSERNPDFNYRLPTEAEWEYACRAGTTGDYYGNLNAIAWYSGNSATTTHPVGQKTPNAWGLFDMSGNVWEWCHDWYGSDYYQRSPRDDPQGPPTGRSRVIRGGSENASAAGCRSSARAMGRADDRSGVNIGFRVVMVPE